MTSWSPPAGARAAVVSQGNVSGSPDRACCIICSKSVRMERQTVATRHGLCTMHCDPPIPVGLPIVHIDVVDSSGI